MNIAGWVPGREAQESRIADDALRDEEVFSWSALTPYFGPDRRMMMYVTGRAKAQRISTF